jgi:hypothetical protein
MSPKSEKVLTAKIAQKAIKGGEYDLSKYTDVEDSAAEFLAEHKGYIKLDGISQLTDHLARYLAKHEGGLSLGGISSLSEESSAILAKRQGSIELNGLKKLGNESARHLIQCPEALYLNGLADISDEVLKILAKHTEALGLVAFNNLSSENAKILSEHQGGLFLGNFKNISPEIANVLAKHPGHLTLGIENLSDEILDIFSEREEGAYIYDLYDIEAVAKAEYSDDREFIVSLLFEYCDVKGRDPKSGRRPEYRRENRYTEHAGRMVRGVRHFLAKGLLCNPLPLAFLHSGNAQSLFWGR